MTAAGFPHSDIHGSKPCWRLPVAYRGLTRPSSVLSAKASTTAPLQATHTHTRRGARRPIQQIPGRQKSSHQKRSQNDRTTIKNRVLNETCKTKPKNKRLGIARVHYPVLKPPRANPKPHPGTQATGGRGRAGPHHAKRGVAVREPKSMPIPQANGCFHTSIPRQVRTIRTLGFAPSTRQWIEFSVERR